MVAMDVMSELKVLCTEPTSEPPLQAAGATSAVAPVAVARNGNARFKHVMARVGFYAGQSLVDAAIVAGYVAMGMAVATAAN